MNDNLTLIAADAEKKRRDLAFGLVLRDKREKSGFTQESLAFESQLDRSYISLLERGERSPSLNTIYLLSVALKTTSSEMVREWEVLAAVKIA